MAEAFPKSRFWGFDCHEKSIDSARSHARNTEIENRVSFEVASATSYPAQGFDLITDIGIMDIDQTTGLGYLADKTNKSVVVFDTKTDKFVSRIPGFVGRLKDGDASGPNGVVVVKGGAEVWVSDGDSTIKVIDT